MTNFLKRIKNSLLILVLFGCSVQAEQPSVISDVPMLHDVGMVSLEALSWDRIDKQQDAIKDLFRRSTRNRYLAFYTAAFGACAGIAMYRYYNAAQGVDAEISEQEKRDIDFKYKKIKYDLFKKYEEEQTFVGRFKKSLFRDVVIGTLCVTASGLILAALKNGSTYSWDVLTRLFSRDDIHFYKKMSIELEREITKSGASLARFVQTACVVAKDNQAYTSSKHYLCGEVSVDFSVLVRAVENFIAINLFLLDSFVQKEENKAVAEQIKKTLFGITVVLSEYKATIEQLVNYMPELSTQQDVVATTVGVHQKMYAVLRQASKSIGKLLFKGE